MITQANTDDLREIAKSIDDSVSRLEDKFSALYKRLDDVPYGTKEWFGNKADYYFNSIKSDEDDYKQICNNLRDIVNILNNEADSIESIVNEVNK